MNDPHDPHDPHDLDELASAHLDGATTPAEAARVDADPALQARVEELRAVREAVGAVPPVDPSIRDAAIARALASLDEDDATSSPLAPVAELAPRRGLSPRAIRAVGAAAAVVLLALLVPLLANVRDDGDDAASSDVAADAFESGGTTASDGGALAPESAGGDATAGAASGPGASVGTLGAFDDVDALAAAVVSGGLDARAAAPTTNQDDAAVRCGSAADAGPIVAIAVVAGEPVEVYLRSGPDGTRTLTVVSGPTCQVLDQRDL